MHAGYNFFPFQIVVIRLNAFHSFANTFTDTHTHNIMFELLRIAALWKIKEVSVSEIDKIASENIYFEWMWLQFGNTSKQNIGHHFRPTLQAIDTIHWIENTVQFWAIQFNA